MKELYIDTSLTDVSIALLSSGKVIASICKNTQNKHSEYAVKYISELLEQSNIKPNEINRIYVVNGPGSFTGVRIGVTIAKTYAYLNNINIIPVSSLKALALSIKTNKSPIMALIDFKHNNYYVGLYDSNYNEIIKETFTNIDNVQKIINKYSPTLVSSDNTIIDNIKLSKCILDIQEIVKYYQDKEEINPHKLKINYLKEPQAVEELYDNRERK